MNIYEAAMYARETGKMVRQRGDNIDAYWDNTWKRLRWNIDHYPDVNLGETILTIEWEPVEEWRKCTTDEAEKALIAGKKVQCDPQSGDCDLWCIVEIHNDYLFYKAGEDNWVSLAHSPYRKWRVLDE